MSSLGRTNRSGGIGSGAGSVRTFGFTTTGVDFGGVTTGARGVGVFVDTGGVTGVFGTAGIFTGLPEDAGPPGHTDDLINTTVKLFSVLF
jgi:hypothetical protein